MLARIAASGIGLGLALAGTVMAAGSERIRLNQVGYGIGQPKLAVLLNNDSAATLVDSATGTEVFRASTGKRLQWTQAADTARLFDFSTVNQPGTYLIKAGTETSHPVRISANPFTALAKASIKAYWYNRSSYELKAPWAGVWAREAGHPDTAVFVHASAATAKRPEGTLIRSPGGWYDAGDYGKYVVNSGITTWTLLHLHATAHAMTDTLKLNVPEHAAGSDLLDEILWNLRWMLSMQDPDDGGVYHKLTTANFDAFEMPVDDIATRYVVRKTTAATLDLAATAAYAARILRDRPEFKDLADSCQTTALKAWAWARKNPRMYWKNIVASGVSPAVTTGDYGDGNVSDEFQWAGMELFLTTGADSFATAVSLKREADGLASIDVPSWQVVSGLAWYSLLSHDSLQAGLLSASLSTVRSALLATAASFLDSIKTTGYHLPEWSSTWGSNSVYANKGILLWKAWQISGDTSYRNASLDVLDFLLGRNATGYCFVTGQGSKSPRRIHHRPSGADGIALPVPGFLVGGPNLSAPGQDLQKYTDTIDEAKVYVDVQGSYATNEIAINWNAPLVFLAGVWSQHQELVPSGIAVRSRSATPALRTTLAHGRLQVDFGGKVLKSVELVSLDGKRLARTEGAQAAQGLQVSGSGMRLVRATAQDGSVGTARLILP